jgi:hypothetical protein
MSRIKAHKAKAGGKICDPQPAASTEPQEEAYGDTWPTIRRNENHMRKLLGLPPLTDAEWNAKKQEMEECRKANEQLWGNVNWPTWKPHQ